MSTHSNVSVSDHVPGERPGHDRLVSYLLIAVGVTALAVAAVASVAGQGAML